jgi:hypothetical protein
MAAWTALDGKVDGVLTSVRAPKPSVPAESAAVKALLDAFG